MKLSSWLNVPTSCVYALVCHSKRRFLVGYTSSMLGVLYRLSKDLETPKYKLLKMDIDEVDIEVIQENIENNINTKIHIGIVYNDFIAKGYTPYIPSNFVHYTVKRDVYIVEHHAYHTVYLLSSRKEKVIVGLFRDVNSMNKFCDKYYKDDKVTGLFYSNNIYTNNYFKRYGYRFKELSKE